MTVSNPQNVCVYRKGTQLDLPGIMQLVQAAIQHMDEQGIPQWDEIYPTETDFAQDIQNEQLFVGEAEGRIAVTFTLSEQCDPAYQNGSWKNPQLSFQVIHRLCVHPDFQGCGIALQSVQYLETMLKEQGVQAVRLDVFTRNPYALKLYQRCGYQQTGTADWRKGKFNLMEKCL